MAASFLLGFLKGRDENIYDRTRKTIDNDYGIVIYSRITSPICEDRIQI